MKILICGKKSTLNRVLFKLIAQPSAQPLQCCVGKVDSTNDDVPEKCVFSIALS